MVHNLFFRLSDQAYLGTDFWSDKSRLLGMTTAAWNGISRNQSYREVGGGENNSLTLSSLSSLFSYFREAFEKHKRT